MKNLKKLLFTIFLSIFIISSSSFAKENSTINIFFTHDIHDHVEDFNISENGQNLNIGGYERINQAIQNQLKEDKDSLILDAGDYSMGTLFQTIFSTENPSLRLLGEMGYDATTLGNHEFDFRTRGLADSLLAAKNSGDKLPELLTANIDLENYENVDEQEVKNLKNAFDEYGVKEYIVLDKKGYKIGIFGLMGNDSISNAPMAGVTDGSFRYLCSRFGAGMSVSELISSRALIFGNKRTIEAAVYDPIQRPYSVQLFGYDPKIMAEAAKIVEGHGICDIIDINMGCPVSKVVKTGAGSALMKTPKLAAEIFRAVKNAVNLPVTVKFRLGWTQNTINHKEFTKIM